MAESPRATFTRLTVESMVDMHTQQGTTRCILECFHTRDGPARSKPQRLTTIITISPAREPT